VKIQRRLMLTKRYVTAKLTKLTKQIKDETQAIANVEKS